MSPMKVAIFGRNFQASLRENVAILFSRLQEIEARIYVFKSFYDYLTVEAGLQPQVAGFFTDHSDLPEDTRFMFSLGGDGTFLETVALVQDSGIPVVGINTGRLGFLSYISQESLSESLDSLFSGHYEIEERMLLKVESTVGLMEGTDVALNEVRIYKRDASLIKVHVRINDEFLSTYWADGLILSTPTGSTAYNLSVGGPIVVPESQNFILSPIAPHNLTVRPLVLPDSVEIHMSVDTREDSYMLAIDSHAMEMPADSSIVLRRADYTLKMIRIENNSFYLTLRNKLMWGADKRN